MLGTSCIFSLYFCISFDFPLYFFSPVCDTTSGFTRHRLYFVKTGDNPLYTKQGISPLLQNRGDIILLYMTRQTVVTNPRMSFRTHFDITDPGSWNPDPLRGRQNTCCTWYSTCMRLEDSVVAVLFTVKGTIQERSNQDVQFFSGKLSTDSRNCETQRSQKSSSSSQFCVIMHGPPAS